MIGSSPAQAGEDAAMDAQTPRNVQADQGNLDQMEGVDCPPSTSS
jgi:hypothetical protein